MKQKIFSLILSLLLITSGFAQNHLAEERGKVTGKITDENGKNVEYAILAVVRATDTATVATGISDPEGKFEMTDIRYGEYMLKVECMGYRTHYSQSFELSHNTAIKNFPKFQLKQKSTSLKAVEVTAKKEMLQSNLDKKVFNVESSIVTEGATAVEVLEEVPSVDVDLDGNVTLRGSENVTILIDGHPTNMTLDQIPAEQIESIEVITNPSARLEPDGMAGILNVILKKKRESGFNGLVSLGGALSFFESKPYFDRYNGNINLNYNYNKINVFLNYNYRHFGHHGSGTIERDSWLGNDTTHLSQDNRNNGGGGGHTVKTGLDWFINKQNTLSFSFDYNYFSGDNDRSLLSENSKLLNGESLIRNGYRQNTTNGNLNHNWTGSINYKKEFNTQGQELTADIYYTQRHRESWSDEGNIYYHPDSMPSFYQNTTTIENNRNASAQVDFVTPVGNGGRIETGYKLSYRFIGQDYSLLSGNEKDNLLEDLSQSNNFDYSEMINAAYFIYSNSFWEKLKIQVGLRGELANTRSDLKSIDTIYKNNYFNLFPTVHIRYDFSTAHSLQVSYSRRVSRPRIYQLNPFLDYSDRQNWTAGNPNLQPEFVNSLELGYLMNIDKSSLNATLFYRQRKDIISRYTELLNDTITLTTYKNLRTSQNFGLELTYGQRLWKFWKITLTGNLYYEIIDSEHLLDENLSNSWNWSVRLNQTFSLPKSWDLQLNFRYRSPGLTVGSMGWGNNGVGQGKRSARYNMSLGVKKGFFNNNFTIALNIRNLIYNRKNNIHTYSYGEANGYDAYSIRYRDGLQINLSLSYKFNNYKKRQERNTPDEYGEGGED